MNKTANLNDSCYFTKKIKHTGDITNNITRHTNNKYEHKAIKKVHTHINRMTNYCTEVNYCNKKSYNKTSYCNFYHSNLNFIGK